MFSHTDIMMWTYIATIYIYTEYTQRQSKRAYRNIHTCEIIHTVLRTLVHTHTHTHTLRPVSLNSIYSAVFLCFAFRFNLYPQQRCGFRKTAKKVEPKKGSVEEAGQPHTEQAESLVQRRAELPPTPPAPKMPPRAYGQLLKPLVFTVGVGS